MLLGLAFMAGPRVPKQRRLPASGWIALVLILLAHAILKSLELRQASIHTYFPLGPEELERPWRLLLPVEISGVPGGNAYRWSPLGVILVSLLDLLLTPPKTFLVLTLLSVVSSFFAGWVAFRSLAVSVTFALCTAFGTQFDYAFVNSSCVLLPLLWIHGSWNLVALYKLGTSDALRTRWRLLFGATLVGLALTYEMWLDYAAFLALALGWGFLLRKRISEVARREISFAAVTLGLVGGCYVLVKLAMGGSEEHLRPGQEAEVVLTYFKSLPPGKALVIAIEDVVSNLFTYNFIAWTNYLPPFLLGSTSIRTLGTEGVIAQQFGYHQAYTHLVGAHHIFLWYFGAGMVSLAFYVGLFRSVRNAWATPTLERTTTLLLLLLAGSGAATHLIIKYRPYLSVPLLSYKCMFAVLGVTAYIAFALELARRRLSEQRFRLVAAGVWCTIIAAGMTRPSWLGSLSSLVGLSPSPGPFSTGH